MNINDLTIKLKNYLTQSGRNLSAWKQVVSQPQLRQEYRQQIIQPKVQQVSNYVKPILQQQYSPRNIIKMVMPQISGARMLPQVGRQMMKIPQAPELVGPTLKAGPTRVPILGPIQQAPRFLTESIKSYGRTLAEPQKHPLETALNVLPFLPMGRLKAILPKGKIKIKPTIGEIADYESRALAEARSELKAMEMANPDQQLFGKMRNFLRFAGEKTSRETGELFREHIPRRVFGESSDELASSMGITENGLMAKLTENLPMAGETRGVISLPRISKRAKDLYEKLDPQFYKTIRDVFNKVEAVSAKVIPFQLAQKRAQTAEQIAKQSYREWQSSLFKQEGVRTTRGAVETAIKGIKEKTISPLSSDVENLKDISGFSGGMRDIYRNFKAVFGQKIGVAKRLVLDPFDKSKGEFIDELNQWTGTLENYVGKKLGIRKGSLESAAVQEFGEKTLSEADLLRKFGIQKTKNIIEADNWFRQSYNQLLDEVNAVRAKIYPNDPTKIIPRRQDYYRHFRELAQGFRGLANIFDVPANIASPLSGISEFTKPKAKWLSFAQRRLGLGTDIDAVGGFLDYIKASSYAKHIDPNIPKFRALADELAQATSEGTLYRGKLNNFIEFLHDFSNDLAGKTNPLDRTLQKWIPGGRKTFRVINWMNSRVKANVMLGNASASLAQIFNVPQGMANVQNPKYWIKGIGKTLASMFVKNRPMENSVFIKERYFKAFDKFNRGLLYQPYRFTKWMITALDEVGTKYIWNMSYDKALDMGITNATKYADDIARSMVAGRGIGEVPLAQKSRLFQMIAPFQIEVTNLWWVMKDFIDERAFGKIATLFVFNHLFNNAAERIRGSRVTFDPIQATLEAINTFQQEESKGKGALMAGGRLVGEVLSNIPVGQTFGAMYPEYGFKIGETQYPTRKQFFGREDPTRFGGGILVTRGITDPLYKLLPPYGGQQIKRTIGGLGAYGKGYAESAKGLVQYPIEKKLTNLLQAGTFGKTALPEAQKYFKEERTPLGEKQSLFFKQAPTTGTHQLIMKRREFDKLNKKAKELIDDGQTKKAIELMKANKEIFQQGEVLKEFDKRMGKLSEARKKAMEDKRLTEEQRKKVLAIIDQQIKQMSDQANKLNQYLEGGQ